MVLGVPIFKHIRLVYSDANYLYEDKLIFHSVESNHKATLN